MVKPAQEQSPMKNKVESFITDIKTIYAMLAAIVGLTITLTTFVVKYQAQVETIESLETSNTALTETVGTLQQGVAGLTSAQTVFNASLSAFNANPPGVTVYRLDQLEKKVEKHHHSSHVVPDTAAGVRTFTPPTGP